MASIRTRSGRNPLAGIKRNDIEHGEAAPHLHSHTNYEQETIINFNKQDDMASVYTYEKTWQVHFEKKLGIKPTADDGFGGKTYMIDKKRIPKPRTPKKMTPEARNKLAERLKMARLAKPHGGSP